MASRRVAVRAAQTILNTRFPEVKPDGIWGRKTDNAFESAPVEMKGHIRIELASLGWDVSVLRLRAAVSVEYIARRARVAGIQGKSLVNFMATLEAESRFKSVKESHYYSDPSRARAIFGALRNMSDDAIRRIVAAGPNVFFETVYGYQTQKGRELGNKKEGDGAKFPGRGLIQLTGLSNYQAAKQGTGHDIVSNPDLLLTDIMVSTDVAIWYWKTRVEARGAAGDMASATDVVNRGLPQAERQARLQLVAKYSVLNATLA